MKHIFLILVLVLITNNMSIGGEKNLRVPFHGLNTQGEVLAVAEFSTVATPAWQFDDLKKDPQRKSVGKALLLSLAIPGAGELYMGKKGMATFFFGAEILAWTGLLFNNLYSDHLKTEYHTYAVEHAGVDKQGKGVQYWIDIGKFDDIYSFNEQRRRDRFFDAMYDENQANIWAWDSENNRFRYDGKRIRANEIASQDVYFQAAVLLNHLVSGINAVRLARKHNRDLKEPVGWSMRFDSHREYNNSNYFGLSFSTRF